MNDTDTGLFCWSGCVPSSASMAFICGDVVGLVVCQIHTDAAPKERQDLIGRKREVRVFHVLQVVADVRATPSEHQVAVSDVNAGNMPYSRVRRPRDDADAALNLAKGVGVTPTWLARRRSQVE